jgi:membrane-bound metal-dependent hydrolase YbcI (DUF457 family)
MLALGSALGCVGGIACLSSQQTARLGIAVGMSGIGTGLVGEWTNLLYCVVTYRVALESVVLRFLLYPYPSSNFYTYLLCLFPATLGYMNPADVGTYAQLGLMAGSGAGVGYYISGKISPTELPQAVSNQPIYLRNEY